MRLLAAVLLAGLMAPAALAAPPPNDSPAAPGSFEPYTAENGTPGELQAIAELAEARSDRGVPRCLGSGSFARTVWFRIPSSGFPRELRVEASGRTLEVVDLAAFVQTPVEGRLLASRPNTCAGHGAGGSDLAADRTSALTLRVPPYRPVLIQVGRRGNVGHPDDERAVLTMSEAVLPSIAQPPGDEANFSAPKLRMGRTARVPLGGATTTEDDPAAPACPALAGVWRRVKTPRRPRRAVWAISAAGRRAATLTAFTGRRVRPRGFRGCVDRDGEGPLVLPIRARRKKWIWIRVGTDRPPDAARARLRVRRAGRSDVESGGGCLASLKPRVAGRLGAGSVRARQRNRSRKITLVLRVRGGPVCAARAELIGRRGRTYAARNIAILRDGTQVVRMRRTRRLVRGRYKLAIEAAAPGGVRAPVRSRVSFRLR